MQATIDENVLRTLMFIVGADRPGTSDWPADGEGASLGASLIRTMGKVWSDQAPPAVGFFLIHLGQGHGRVESATVRETSALAVAHLLPAFLRRV